jgi:hypothetical protein
MRQTFLAQKTYTTLLLISGEINHSILFHDKFLQYTEVSTHELNLGDRKMQERKEQEQIFLCSPE